MSASGQHLVLFSIDENERPVSIRTLGAYAESLGVRTTLLVAIKPLPTFGHPVSFDDGEVRQIAAFLDRERVTHLGFSLMTAGLHPYAKLVGLLRAAGYRGVVMAGGVHPTLCPAESLVEGADFAIQGPGEVPLGAVLAGAPPESIPGLVWRRDGAAVVNAPSKSQRLDLDSLPYPIFRFDRDRILVGGKLRRLTWSLHRRHASWDGRYYDMVTSRGCVYRCAYCCNVNGAPVRRAGVDRVIAEIRSVRQRAPRVAGVNFQDDSFYAGSDEWLEAFCSRMKSECGTPFVARMIPRYVTEERIQRMKAAGLEYVTMGLEGSDRMNRSVFNRAETANSFLSAARTVLGAGIYLSADIIVDNPYETESDLRQIAGTLNALPRPNWGVVALSLTPFPNTPLYARCVQDKMLARFGTDAYDSMLNSSRPGGYRTPSFWKLLNTELLPSIPRSLGERLIAAGAGNAHAAQTVERLATRLRRAKRITAWFNGALPWLQPVMRRALRKAMLRRGRSAAGS
jgi:radical SAM superfamily enzyme YgiQ (UPF0313 family)